RLSVVELDLLRAPHRARYGDRRNDHDGPGVHDVRAETAASAALRLPECFGEAFATRAHPLPDGKEHLRERDLRSEATEEEREDGPGVADAEGEADGSEHASAEQGRSQCAAQLLPGGATSVQRRAHSHGQAQADA